MNAPAKLGLYAAGLAVLFTAALLGARAWMPADAASAWTAATQTSVMEHDTAEAAPAARAVRGLSVEQDGYQITEVAAPTRVGQPGTLSFRLTGPDGTGVTAYTNSHEKDLHLIVVRSDGTGFRHVHPTHDGAGNWSLPWTWDAAGTYRIFADFVPTDLGADITLTSSFEVTGAVTSRPTPHDSATDTVDGYKVELTGTFTVGTDSILTLTVSRDGQPVTTLQPYLGAYGHLVALRAGDLAYLHVHPMGEPGDGTTLPGPAIAFMSQAPTAGKYLLYLDFQIDGVVHTAQFVVTATALTGGSAASSNMPEHSDDGH